MYAPNKLNRGAQIVDVIKHKIKILLNYFHYEIKKNLIYTF